MISLTPKHPFKVPVDGENITPDCFAGKSVSEIKQLQVLEGNRERTLDDLFKIDFEEAAQSGEQSIQLRGDFTKVKRIGAKMSLGHIAVEGSVGMRLGEEMRGGAITVACNADSWAGMMMRGGVIEVTGDAGDYLGAAYRGSTVGMKGGMIIVHGNVGNEAGCYMNNGLIRIDGDAGPFAGVHMRDGTILIRGNAGERVGAEMAGGKIIVLGAVPSILPSFTVDSIRKSVRIDQDKVEGLFYLFKGDITESWNGSLYVATGKNPHLKIYESKIL